MPELPEVEIVKQGLLKNIRGLTVKKVSVFSEKLRFRIPENIISDLEKKKIKGILRRGKHGIILTNGQYHLHFHLGMTGYFKIFENRYIKNKHDHLMINFHNHTSLIYNDVRKFGYFSMLKKPIDIANFKNLGFEPNHLFLEKKRINRKFSGKSRTIKNILLDQTIISGIGNIYACEILYDAKILPTRSGNNIKKNELNKILESAVKVLNKAIEKGGTTIRDYKNIEGNLGYFQNEFKVYDRKGLPCFKCESLIIRIKQSGRSTYYCPNCQI